MAHYALLNSDNIVTQVITGRDEDDRTGDIENWEEYYGNFHGQRCLRTSYNTFNNQHNNGGTPFRGNYAGIGNLYLEEHDIFISPQPFDSWILDMESASWAPPKPYPANEDGIEYMWDENSLDWVQNDGT